MTDRLTTFLRSRIIGPLGAGRARRAMPVRAVFLHIPRTGGTSLHAVFHRLAGGPRTGQSAMIDDRILDRPDQIALAHRARYVGGHFGRLALDAVRGDAVAFTFLRDPVERIVSTWRFAQTFTDPARRLPFGTLEEALTSNHPAVTTSFDNVIARQLAVAFDPVRAAEVPRDEWVGRARDTLAALDHVGTVAEYDRHVAGIMGLLHLGPDATVEHLNRPEAPHRGRADRIEPPPVPDAALPETIVAPHVALDREVCAGWL